MRNLIIILCMLCASIVNSLPQYSVEAQIIGSQQQLPQAQPQAFTDSPDANIIAFSPERTRAIPSGAVLLRSQSRYQPEPVRPEVPEQYFVPRQPAPVPVALPQQPIQQQYVAPQPQPQSQPQPQIREHSRQQYTSVPTEEVSRHPHPATTPIPILKLDKSQSLDGSYKQSWESANNIIVEETGFLKDVGPKDEKALVQQGSYSYQTPDGTVISTSYTADEGGFKVEGSHLPTPPPIPEEIQKGLNQIYEGIRLQQEQEARDIKEGKATPKVYDNETGLPIEQTEANYRQQPVAHRRQYQQYQPAVQQPVQQPAQQYQPQYQSPISEQTEAFQRVQPYRQ